MPQLLVYKAQLGVSHYSDWSNFPQNQSFLPITAWLQNANALGVVSGGRTVAQAAADIGVNILNSLDDGGVVWPPSFGTDDGRLAAIYAAGLYWIAGANGGITTSNNTARDSVASFIAVDQSLGGGRLVGYNGGDEPQCGPPMSSVPVMAAAVAGYDPTRPFFFNKLGEFFRRPVFYCPPDTQTAVQAVGVACSDIYALLSPYLNAVSGSDHISLPQDSLWVQGMVTNTMRAYARPGQPIWAFIAGGSDALNYSPANNFFTGAIEDGSTTLTFVTKSNGVPLKFTSAWEGLTLAGAGLQASTLADHATDDTHLVMSKAATATGNITVTVTGGANNDCVDDGNICVVNGNRYRATPAELMAEYMINLVNGATGFQLFVHDNTSYAYSFGATAGGAGALAAAEALTYINGIMRQFAPVINSPTVAICSMHSMDPYLGDGFPTVAPSCSDGILTMATSDIAVPGAALAKSYNGATYLLTQPSMRGSANMTFTLTGKAGQVATCVYDTNLKYDSAHSAVGSTFTLNGSAQFTDTFGAHNNHYQTKIYRIQ